MTETFYKITAGVSGKIKFAFVSDLHDCCNFPVLKAIDKNKVDAVLVGGDFIHNNEMYKRGLAFLRRSAEKYPTFCSFGNHEKRFKGDISALVSDSGAVPLDNGYTDFMGIKIAGLSSGHSCSSSQSKLKCTPPPDTSWLSEFEEQEGYKILLSHHPEYYDVYIRSRNIDLILSGHAHGGQWRFFGRGLFAPGQGIFPKYTSGMYENRLIVNRGLGNPHSVPRINNKPEVVIIELI